MNNPELHVQHNQPQRDMIARVVSKYLDKFQWRTDGVDTIIDVGSGPGDMFMEIVWPLLGRNFTRIVLSDLQLKMLQFAKARYQHVDNCEFKLFDIATDREIPSDLKGKFDHVVSFHCLHLVQNQMKSFQSLESFQKCGARSSKNDENCGFNHTEVKYSEKCRDFDSPEKFKDVMLSISPFVNRMPQVLHRQFIDECFEAIICIDPKCRILTECNGKFRYFYENLTIYARRSPCK